MSRSGGALGVGGLDRMEPHGGAHRATRLRPREA